MKKHLSLFAILGLLLSCQGKDNSSGGDDNGGGNKEVLATAISLNKSELTLEKGATEVLTVSYIPSNVTNKTVAWASSNTGIATITDGTVVAIAPGNTEIVAKCGNASAKCVVTVVISATGICLNEDNLVLHVGEKETLMATIEPSNTTDQVLWSTSDASVATVENGLVSAIAVGTSTITATVGSQSAACGVVVKTPVPEGAVDLGLSVYWASCNLGASAPEEFGDYFAWGETEPNYNSQNPLIWKEGKTGYGWESYKWCNGIYGSLIKYNTDSSMGPVDNKLYLDESDDAAHVNLGGGWRMPTNSEWMELRTKCTEEWTTLNGVRGHLVTSPNGCSIFLPAAGERSGTGLVAGWNGFYWSSFLDSENPNYAWMFGFNSGEVYSYGDARCFGYSIRPVSD